jgi:hypothetical protein
LVFVLRPFLYSCFDVCFQPFFWVHILSLLHSSKFCGRPRLRISLSRGCKGQFFLVSGLKVICF